MYTINTNVQETSDIPYTFLFPDKHGISGFYCNYNLNIMVMFTSVLLKMLTVFLGEFFIFFSYAHLSATISELLRLAVYGYLGLNPRIFLFEKHVFTNICYFLSSLM